MSIRTSLLVASLLVATPALASSDLVSKMYDLRDLSALLPSMTSHAASGSSDPFAAGGFGAPRSARKIPILGDLPILGQTFTIADPAGDASGTTGMGLSTDPINPNPSSDESPTDVLVAKLCNLVSLSNEELVENVYFIEGEEANHKRFADAIESVRGLFQDRIQIEVTCLEVDAAQSPNVGDPAPTGTNPGVTAKTVTIRKSQARVQATRSVTYISRWTPIVGDNSVGLEPGTSTATDGVVLDVRVAGGKDKQRVSVQGAISKVEITNIQVPSDQTIGANTSLSPGGPLVTIGLPRTDRRVIDTDVSIELKRPTVVACVPGFKEGKQIVVVVTLKNVE